MLAFYYYKIAKNMPRVLNPENEHDQPKDYKALYWIGIVLNALVPIYEAVNMFFLIYYPQPPKWALESSSAVVFAIDLLETVSGTFLIWSVFKIKSFLNWRGEDG